MTNLSTAANEIISTRTAKLNNGLRAKQQLTLSHFKTRQNVVVAKNSEGAIFMEFRKASRIPYSPYLTDNLILSYRDKDGFIKNSQPLWNVVKIETISSASLVSTAYDQHADFIPRLVRFLAKLDNYVSALAEKLEVSIEEMRQAVKQLADEDEQQPMNRRFLTGGGINEVAASLAAWGF
jgi:hypothetical protein